jgi:hypothetical protein
MNSGYRENYKSRDREAGDKGTGKQGTRGQGDKGTGKQGTRGQGNKGRSERIALPVESRWKFLEKLCGDKIRNE